MHKAASGLGVVRYSNTLVLRDHVAWFNDHRPMKRVENKNFLGWVLPHYHCGWMIDSCKIDQDLTLLKFVALCSEKQRGHLEYLLNSCHLLPFLRNAGALQHRYVRIEQ